MSLRAKRGNRTEAGPLCIACDCFVVPPRNDIVFIKTEARKLFSFRASVYPFALSMWSNLIDFQIINISGSIHF